MNAPLNDRGRGVHGIPTPVLYLDFDGTVRHGFDELGRFVNRAEDVVLYDGMTEILAFWVAHGWRIAGVSNQGGVALGHVSREDCVAAMRRTNELAGRAFDQIAFCTHHPDAKNPEMARCWCRKPRPGLLFEVAHGLRARFHGEYYPPHLALMVGDRPEDEAAAEGACVRFLDAKEWRRLSAAAINPARSYEEDEAFIGTILANAKEPTR